MYKGKVQIFTVIGIVLFIAGLTLLIGAANLGMEAASRAIQANGGSMETDKYYFIMESVTRSYQIAGAICSLVGGLGMVLSPYGRQKKEA